MKAAGRCGRGQPEQGGAAGRRCQAKSWGWPVPFVSRPFQLSIGNPTSPSLGWRTGRAHPSPCPRPAPPCTHLTAALPIRPFGFRTKHEPPPALRPQPGPPPRSHGSRLPPRVCPTQLLPGSFQTRSGHPQSSPRPGPLLLVAFVTDGPSIVSPFVQNPAPGGGGGSGGLSHPAPSSGPAQSWASVDR